VETDGVERSVVVVVEIADGEDGVVVGVGVEMGVEAIRERARRWSDHGMRTELESRAP
jgi:hypothetical protein